MCAPEFVQTPNPKPPKHTTNVRPVSCNRSVNLVAPNKPGRHAVVATIVAVQQALAALVAVQLKRADCVERLVDKLGAVDIEGLWTQPDVSFAHGESWRRRRTGTNAMLLQASRRPCMLVWRPSVVQRSSFQADAAAEYRRAAAMASFMVMDFGGFKDLWWSDWCGGEELELAGRRGEGRGLYT